MSSVESMLSDHENIERELVELESILDEDNLDEDVNVSNFVHVFKKISAMLDSHEERENIFLSKISNEKNKEILEKLEENHQTLGLEIKGYRLAIKESIDLQDELELKASLMTDVKFFVDKIRKHFIFEEKILKELKNSV